MSEEIKMVEPGAEYVFSGKYSRHEILRGEVLEVIEDGKVARVKLAEDEAGKVYPYSPIDPEGAIARVYLPLMKAERVRTPNG